MSSSCESSPPILCGCCQGVTKETPALMTNRPGLSAISYRVGTHTTFLASLLAALSDSNLPALAPLRTRDLSDFSIALLDAWAASLDILSFYQERIANESYLRTAVDPASVFALAQLVGYKPSPGVAASAILAFTLNSAPSSPDNVLIAAGTRVQSVPNPGQPPQVFETSSDLTAIIARNAIPAQTTVPWALNSGDTSVWLQGTNNNLRVGDWLLFTADQFSTADPWNSGGWDYHVITDVSPDATSGNTFVTWDAPLLLWSSSNVAYSQVYVFRKKAALFGSQAPDPRTLSTTGNNIQSLAGWPSNGAGDWQFQYAGNSQVSLDAPYSGLVPAQAGPPEWALFLSPVNTYPPYQVLGADDFAPVLYTLTSKATQLSLANEPLLDPSGNVNQTNDEILTALVAETRQITAYVQSELLTPVDSPYLAGSLWSSGGTSYQTQPELLLPVEGSSLEVVTNQQFANGQPVAVFGKRLRLQVTTASQTLDPQASFTAEDSTAGVPLSNGQMFLIDAFPPSTVAGGSDQAWAVLTTDGVAGEIIINPLNVVLVPADKNDPVVGESVVLSQPLAGSALQGTVALTGGSSTVTGTGTSFTSALNTGQSLLFGSDPTRTAYQVGAIISDTSLTLTSGFLGSTATSTTATVVDATSITTLAFNPPLQRIYDRTTVAVNVNTVEATQGETMNEILGSGDATNAALQFTLKQSPLTYVSSTLNNGALSTLQVWVNNMRWHEVDHLLASGPEDRVFITETDSNQKVTVRFGDGVEGERTPTGQMNIRAVYRKGIGSAGNVQGGQLSQALDRPQGLTGVTNASPASGGADPDCAAGARASAPLHVLTLGRVVSLEDYQNYTLAFAGIAKALATWTWFGGARGVFLTVAGANGSVFRPDDPILSHLKTALWSVGNPHVPLQVVSYRPALFEVGGNVQIDTTDYDSTQVLAQVWESLITNFSFSQRGIGQGVAQSEVIALVQQTPGVIAVELTAFNRQDQPPTTKLPAVLLAASPTVNLTGVPLGGELLLLDPASQGNFEVGS